MSSVHQVTVVVHFAAILFSWWLVLISCFKQEHRVTFIQIPKEGSSLCFCPLFVQDEKRGSGNAAGVDLPHLPLPVHPLHPHHLHPHRLLRRVHHTHLAAVRVALAVAVSVSLKPEHMWEPSMAKCGFCGHLTFSWNVISTDCCWIISISDALTTFFQQTAFKSTFYVYGYWYSYDEKIDLVWCFVFFFFRLSE